MLAISGKNKTKLFDNIKNDFLVDTSEIYLDAKVDKNIYNVEDTTKDETKKNHEEKVDKNIYNVEDTTKDETKKTHEEKVRQLIEKIRIRQGLNNSQSPRLIRPETSLPISSNFKQLRTNESSLKYRFQAQKNIIEQQKLKLQEKEKIINELKVGIMSEEIKDCQDKTKFVIRELFQDCKGKLIGKVPLDYIPTKNKEKSWIRTQNAPKIIQELEQRAFDRMKYREIIKERKRILDETKKKLREDALEQKKCMEEEEKQKQLETMKEKRREDLARLKLRQINKEKFLKNLDKAIQQYESKLLKHTFSRWKFAYKSSVAKNMKSEKHYRTCILKKSLKTLLDIVELKYTIKYEVAYDFHRKLTLRRTFHILQEHHMDRKRDMQVAEDFNDFTMQSKILRHWYSYMSKEKILTDLKMHQAIHHYRKTLLFKSFFQWKSLSTVLKLEKAKEERKQKWRKKVWEILPDFTPSEI